jgi:hypothetical protein
MQSGFLVTSGLGYRGLLVTSGLGQVTEIEIIIPETDFEQPRHLRHRGSSAKQRQETPTIKCIFATASLVKVNDQSLRLPIEGACRIDWANGDSLIVRSQLTSVKKRKRSLRATGRFVSKQKL